MPFDPAILELIKQLPISVALLIVLLYFIRTNRQDRHELNALATVQAQTEQLSADNQKRLITRTEAFEINLSGVSERLLALHSVIEGLSVLNKTMVARIEQTADVAGRVRSREEAVIQEQSTIDKLSAVVKQAAEPILAGVTMHLGEKDLTHRKLESIHTAMTGHSTELAKVGAAVDALPIRLDALKVKMDALPLLVRQEYAALVAERDALKAQVSQQLADLMARDKTIDALRASAPVVPLGQVAPPPAFVTEPGIPEVQAP